MWKSRREIGWMNDNWIKDHLDIPDMGVINVILPWITKVFLSF